MRHSQVNVGPVELHVVETGSGRPVLFCHGFPDVWIGWRRQMEAVAAAGYRAIAVDTRGYGRSTGPDDPGAYTPFHTIGDLVQLLAALALPQAAIVGHDFGAGAAWYAALLRPDRFPAVFAISVPFMAPGSPGLLDAMAAAGKRDSFYMFKQQMPEAERGWADAAVSYPSFLYWSSGSPPEEDRWDPFGAPDVWRQAPVPRPDWADPDDIAYAVAEFERTGFRRPLYHYHSLRSFADLARALTGRQIVQPAFFLAGAADGLRRIRPYDEAALRRDVPGLRGMALLPGIGHWPHREAPDATNERLVGFLRDVY